MNFYPNKNPLSNNKGIALVFVLWVLILLTVIAGGFSYAMRSELRSTGLIRSEAESYYMAYAGIQTGLFMLENDRVGQPKKTVNTGIIRWGVNTEIPEQSVGRGHFSIKIGNESGKVNMNYANKDLLTVLFTAMDVPEKQIKELVDAVFDWRDRDTLRRLNGAENAYYQSLSKPYKARDNLFQIPDELLYIKGMTKLLYMRLKPLITAVIEDTGKDTKKKGRTRSKINLNAASREVLSIFPDLTEDIIDLIVSYRQEKGDISNMGTLLFIIKDQRNVSVLLKLAKYIDYKNNSFYTLEASGWMENETIKQSIGVLVKKDSQKKKRYKMIQWMDRVSN